jgi:hypothetical protein
VEELGFEEAADLIGSEAVVAEVFDDVANFGLCLEELGGARLCVARCGDVSAGAVTELEQAFVTSSSARVRMPGMRSPSCRTPVSTAWRTCSISWR